MNYPMPIGGWALRENIRADWMEQMFTEDWLWWRQSSLEAHDLSVST